MADLDEGFEEVPLTAGAELDEGFEEVSLEEPKKPTSITKEVSKYSPLTFGTALGLGNINVAKGALGKLRGSDKRDWADIVKQSYSEAYDTGQDLSSGALQGATLGGADEAIGGITAAVKTPFNDKSFKENYREQQQAEESTYKEAKERSPYATTAGELTGGLAAGIATGGLGAEAAVARGLGSVGFKKAAEMGGKKLIQEIGKKSFAAGAEGALAGGIQGALSSEDTLGSDKQLADIGHGVKSGALFGSGIGLVGAGLQAGAAKAKDLMGTTSRAAFERTASGKLPVNAENAGSYGEELLSSRDEMIKKFSTAENKVGRELSDAYQRAETSGIKIPISEALDHGVNQITAFAKNSPKLSLETDPAYKKLLGKMLLIKSNELSPLQAKNLKDELYQFAGKIGDDTLSNIADDFATNIKNSLNEAVPEVKGLNDQYHQLKKYGLESLSTGVVDPTIKRGFVSKSPEKVQQEMYDLLNKVSSSGNPLETEATLTYMKKNLGDLEAQSPGTLKQMGYNTVDDLIKDIRTRGEQFSIGNTMFGQGGLHAGLPTSIAGTAKAAGTAALTGQAPGALKKATVSIAQSAGKVANKFKGNTFYKAPVQAHQAIASSLSSSTNPLAKQMGDNLAKAISEGNIGQRNAVLFTIQQNPTLKQLLQDINPLESSEDNE